MAMRPILLLISCLLYAVAFVVVVAEVAVSSSSLQPHGQRQLEAGNSAGGVTISIAPPTSSPSEIVRHRHRSHRHHNRDRSSKVSKSSKSSSSSSKSSKSKSSKSSKGPKSSKTTTTKSSKASSSSSSNDDHGDNPTKSNDDDDDSSYYSPSNSPAVIGMTTTSGNDYSTGFPTTSSPAINTLTQMMPARVPFAGNNNGFSNNGGSGNNNLPPAMNNNGNVAGTDIADSDGTEESIADNSLTTVQGNPSVGTKSNTSGCIQQISWAMIYLPAILGTLVLLNL